mmetsp:Transcript_57205/g.48306  ORF Transcript_57205/g.48306 Transcript_57205/m.48306 type:complete len:129 (-) Transcript_57205:1188-1574(-)
MRKSIKNSKGLQDLFKEGDDSLCKVFRLQISTAVEVYSDFKKNKFLDTRLLAILENTYIFKTFKPAYLKSIALESELRKFRANDVVFKEGDKSLDLFLIVKGEVFFKKSTGDKLRVMSQSNIFGERGL